MKKVCIEGWRGINHSYAIVNQWQLLELTKFPIDLYHRDIPFCNRNWNPENNFNGFTSDQNQAVSSIKIPAEETFFDITYRISFPYNVQESPSEKLFVFGTAEYQYIDGAFIGGSPGDAIYNERLSIITPSEWSKVGFLNIGFERVHVIPHGIDSKTFHPIDQEEKKQVRDTLGIQDTDFVLLSIGAMTGNKGIGLLIIAFAILRERYPNLKLILKDQSNLYGIRGETYLESLQSSPYSYLLTSDVVSNIIFLSQNLTLHELQGLYGVSDCYVSPYKAEGFNLTPLEAAACGVPIVVTKGGATDDYFNPALGTQIDSMLVRFEDRFHLEPNLDSLVAAISEVIENTNDFGGRKASEYVHRHFSWALVTEKLVELMLG